MRIRSLLITMLGVAVAAGSIYASKEFLAIDQATASVERTTPALVSVVVAGQDIPFGATVEAHKLTTIQWPAEAVPSGIYTDFSELIPASGDEPRRAKRAMVKGELILPAKLSKFGEKVTIGQTLAPGNRAMAISVNATTSVGGFVTPGDFVDIVLTSRDQRGLRAVTILQNIRVVGVDQKADELNEQAQVARTVTVEVTPLKGQKLALAQRAGTLSLTLRNIGAQDEADQELQSIRLSDIVPSDAPVVEAPVPKPTVKVRRGSDIEEVELEGAADDGS
ncbi:MAG: Flp pilus assembly protein CpaB [Pseudomonadota bacterium]